VRLQHFGGPPLAGPSLPRVRREWDGQVLGPACPARSMAEWKIPNYMYRVLGDLEKEGKVKKADPRAPAPDSKAEVNGLA
jgi:hypothetical protein